MNTETKINTVIKNIFEADYTPGQIKQELLKIAKKDSFLTRKLKRTNLHRDMLYLKHILDERNKFVIYILPPIFCHEVFDIRGFQYRIQDMLHCFDMEKVDKKLELENNIYVC